MTREEAERVLRDVPRMTDYAEGMLGDAEGEYVRLDDVLSALEALPSGVEVMDARQHAQEWEDTAKRYLARAEHAEAEIAEVRGEWNKWVQLQGGWIAERAALKAELARFPSRLREAFVAGGEKGLDHWVFGRRSAMEFVVSAAARRYPDKEEV